MLSEIAVLTGNCPYCFESLGRYFQKSEAPVTTSYLCCCVLRTQKTHRKENSKRVII